MKLLVYGINYYPEIIGTGKYNTEMCEWFASMGHSVDVITALPYYPQWEVYPEYKNKKWHKEIINGVNVNRAPLYVPAKVTGKTRVMHELSFGLSTLYYWIPIFFRRYDVVIGVCPPFQTGLYPYLYSICKNKIFIYHIQDLQVDTAKNLRMLNNRGLLYILGKIENYLLRKSTLISTISEGMRNNIIAKGINKDAILLFPNWVDTEFIRPLNREESLRKEWGFQDDDRIVMYSGNIGVKQGLDIVINVANRFRNSKKLYFILVGEGAGKDKLVELAGRNKLKNVRFYPVQPNEELPQLLASADIHLIIQRRLASDLVMPSKLTGILSSGGAAIITAEKGSALYEVININNIGILIEPDDEESLYRAVKENIEKDLTEIRENARAYAKRHLDKKNVLSNFEKELLWQVGISD